MLKNNPLLVETMPCSETQKEILWPLRQDKLKNDNISKNLKNGKI